MIRIRPGLFARLQIKPIMIHIIQKETRTAEVSFCINLRNLNFYYSPAKLAQYCHAAVSLAVKALASFTACAMSAYLIVTA